MKTKKSKSFTKRIRITKNGKVIRRPMGVDHFRMSKPKKLRRSKRKNTPLKTHL
ncbi:MAG: 50S ribosomal protein L35 [Patescibacteria group bacterium]|nr:50S ribosomal protein L35 [Patescibacteria group bacterium]